jgi:hypothetical protein
MRNNFSIRLQPLENNRSNTALDDLIDAALCKPCAYGAKALVKALPILPIAGGAYSAVYRSVSGQTSYYPDTFAEVSMIALVLQDFADSLNLAIQYSALRNDIRNLVSRKGNAASTLRIEEYPVDLIDALHDCIARPTGKKIWKDSFTVSNTIKIVTTAALIAVLGWQISSIKSLDDNKSNHSANIQMTIADFIAIAIMSVYLFLERFCNLKMKQLEEFNKLDKLFAILISEESPEIISDFATNFLSKSAQARIHKLIQPLIPQEISDKVEEETEAQPVDHQPLNSDFDSSNSAINSAAAAAAASAGMSAPPKKTLSELLDEYIALDVADDGSQAEDSIFKNLRRSEIKEDIRNFSNINIAILTEEQRGILTAIQAASDNVVDNSSVTRTSQATDDDAPSLMEEGFSQTTSTASDFTE